MNQMPFGFGVLSQGEVILSRDHDRLMAKKSWLYLWEYLMRNDERIKAAKLPVPYTLDTDFDIQEANNRSIDCLSYLASPDAHLAYLQSDEASEKAINDIPKAFHNTPKNERFMWVVNQVIAENPATVLDVGAGWGEIAVEIARRGIHVTAIAPCELGTEHAKKLQADEGLPIQWIHDIFERLDFGESRFDVVLACEIIEHTANDRLFLQRASELAERCVVVTTPYGSVEKGFYGPLRDWKSPSGQHIRSYSDKSFEDLVGKIPHFKPQRVDVLQTDAAGYHGQRISNFVTKLVRIGKETVSEPVQAQEGKQG